MGVFKSKPYKFSGRIDGKTVVVTGCNTGIGKATAQELYRVGGRVIMACRDVSKAKKAAQEIREAVSDADPNERVGELIIKELDLSSLESIRRCAQDLVESEDQINILINNAGLISLSHHSTVDGFELVFGTNYIGHFYLTVLLLPKILASTPARIVNVASIAHETGSIRWDDLNHEKGFYSMWPAYTQSKLGNVLFSCELASRLEGTGVNVYSLHPGFIATDIASRYMDLVHLGCLKNTANTIAGYIFKTPEEGAATSLFCALDESVTEESGHYYSDCLRAQMAPHAYNEQDRKRLWQETLQMLGMEDLKIQKNGNAWSHN